MLQHSRMITQPTTVAGGQPRTSWATIKSLPPEIFCEIIPFAALQDQAGGYYDRLRVLRLVATSWSALIDNHPKFWTTIRCEDVEPVWRMALRKSKAAEIDVDVRSSFGTKSRTMLIKAIVNHMARVRSLSVIDKDIRYLIDNTSPALCLRSLTLGKGLLDNDGSIYLPFHPAQWAPNLRNVDLIRSRLIWMQPLWNNLEHLRIHAGGFKADLPLQDIFTILKASPGLRSLDLTGTIPPEQHPLPVVKLEALESLEFDTLKSGSPVEALDSIIASPTTRCNVSFNASNETQMKSTLQSICNIASGIADGEAGRKLHLTAERDRSNRFTMGGFDVQLYSKADGKLNTRMNFTQLFEGLSPSRRAVVTTVEIHESRPDPNLVPALLPIVHSFFPNVSHLDVPRVTKALETVLGRPNEGWLFPHLETLSFSGNNNEPRHLTGVLKPRLEAAEAGEHVAQIKTLNLKRIRRNYIDEVEIAELDALVPNVVAEP